MFISYAAYKTIIIIWICIAIFIFFLLQRITAPYGRHTTTGWGPMLDNRTGWIIMELPALTIMGYFFIKNLHPASAMVAVLIGFYCLHYFNRTIIFPFRIHTKGKKMPLIIAASAILFNLANTFFLGYYFTHFVVYDNSWLRDPRFIVGSILFFTGLYINWKADNMLIHLRKPGETHYVMPQGWLFEWISCPNLFGELIEWAGFAILCWNLPALTFFIWSTANLVPRALSHHKWYKNKFPGYPEKRKVIFPFIA